MPTTTSSSPPSLDEALTTRQTGSTTVLELLLGTLIALGPLSIDMYLPALPSIAASLATDVGQVQLTLAVYFVGLAVGQLLTGPLLDRFGRRRPLLVGLAVYVVASLGCATSQSLTMLIALRGVQALGGATAMVASRAVVRDVATGVEAARMLSRLILVMGVAPILAPLLGGWVLEVSGWRAIFLVLAGLGVAIALATAMLLPETATLSHQRAPMRDQLRALATERDFVRATLAGGFAQAGLFAYISGSPFVIIEYFGVDPSNFGWIFGGNAAGLIAMSQLNRRLVTRLGVERVLLLGTGLAALAGVVLAALGVAAVGGLWLMVAALFVFVGVLGVVLPNAVVVALEAHGPRAGTASAVLGAVQFGLGAAAAGAVSLLHDGTAAPMTVTIAVTALLAWWSLGSGRRA